MLIAGCWLLSYSSRSDADAAGCQRKIVGRIADRGGDYLISLKGNQERMHGEIRELFEASFRGGVSCFRSHEETTTGTWPPSAECISSQQPVSSSQSCRTEDWMLAAGC